MHRFTCLPFVATSLMMTSSSSFSQPFSTMLFSGGTGPSPPGAIWEGDQIRSLDSSSETNDEALLHLKHKIATKTNIGVCLHFGALLLLLLLQ
uniref:Putative secreted protein n=1 Tax=Anopheles marajoara TaxID=58244 RepID=A0A2M4C9L1_9DIPT